MLDKPFQKLTFAVFVLGIFMIVNLPSVYAVTDSWVAPQLVKEGGKEPQPLGIFIHGLMFMVLMWLAYRIATRINA